MTVRVSYYPGCTLKSKAKALDEQARAVLRALDIELVEIPEWQCCGAVYPMAKDEIAQRLGAVRALVQAKEMGLPLLTVCSACHHVLKRVNHDMAEDKEIRDKVNAYLQLENPYAGETKVIHFLELLRDQVGFEQLKAKVKEPLTQAKIGAYYGCMLLRPSKVMAMDDAEAPTLFEDILAALGAEPVLFAARNACCGSHQTVIDQKAVEKNSGKVLHSLAQQGGEKIVTVCPLCWYNLQQTKTAEAPEVVYLTELMYRALGLEAMQHAEG